MNFILLFLTGAIFGSFMSAFTFRYPKGISIAKGRSFCPKCKHSIAWYDNIPLLSYLALGGKCRNCKKKISIRYPLIELFSGLGFVFVFVYSPHNLAPLVFNLLIFCILFSIFITDIEHQIIPDDFVFVGVALMLLYLMFAAPNPALLPSLFSGFLAATFLVLIHLFTMGRGMGLGDVKFAVLGGMIVGINLLPIWLISSFLTGGITGIILVLGRKAKLKDKIAFGPFLIIGLGITLVWGEEIFHLLI